jgi:hypothetical protein
VSTVLDRVGRPLSLGGEEEDAEEVEVEVVNGGKLRELEVEVDVACVVDDSFSEVLVVSGVGVEVGVVEVCSASCVEVDVGVLSPSSLSLS